MALNLETKYGARANASSADYPYGSVKNKVGGVAETGTPIEADIMNDFVGLGQKLLDEASIIPSNAPDNVTSSQYYNAMTTIFPTKTELAAAGGSGLVGRFDSVSELLDITPVDGATYEVISYHDSSFKGGGEFTYDASMAQTLHNGGTIIAKDAVFPTTWSNITQKNTWYAGPGAGTGCYVRVNIEVAIPSFFGAKENGADTDSSALYALSSVADEYPILFNGSKTYLIDASAGYLDAVFGRQVMRFDTLTSPYIDGRGATIKCVNHSVAAGVGLVFLWYTKCQKPKFKGFNFDMTFTGVNTSSSFYPWCGGVVFDDGTASGTKTELQRTNDILGENCTFKLFHPYGQFATSGAAYSGDPNNGFKIYSVTAFGDYLAATHQFQNNNCVLRNMTFKGGHNAYGLWVWAYNNVYIDNPKAESWVGKYSNNAGAVIGEGVPMVRYHQFYCKSIVVNNPQFRGKPCDERTIAGFEGSGDAVHFNSNLGGVDEDGGDTLIIGGRIIGGNSDNASAINDKLIYVASFGNFKALGTVFDGYSGTTNARTGAAVVYAGESAGGHGFSAVELKCTFGKNMSYYNNINFLNGDAVISDRRCKLLKLDVTSLSQAQYCLDMSGGSAAAFQGCEKVIIDNLYIEGTNNTLWNSASTNSRAIRFASSAGDVIQGGQVKIIDKYYEMVLSNTSASSELFIDNYSSSGTTARTIGAGAVPVLGLRGTGTPEDVEEAGIGSFFRRKDGGAGTSFYIKESGTAKTGWIGK